MVDFIDDVRFELTGRTDESMEYKIHIYTLATMQSTHAEQQINLMARDGWTLHTVTSVQSYGLIVMQRRVRT